MPSSAKRELKEKGLEAKNITLFLEYSEMISQYFCIFCKRGLFRTQQRIISIMYGEESDSAFNVPISIQCQGCGNIFHLQSFNK